MEFGLKCSYAHGTKAIRTHLDSQGKQAEISWGVFRQLREQWRDRMTLQAVTIVTLDYFSTPAGEQLADLVAESGGILGGVPLMGPDLAAQLDRFFTLAEERHLHLDLHTDESGNPADVTLQHVARQAIARGFAGTIVCGHCCSLSVQPPATVKQTLDLVAAAGIGIVSLPMCNLYLQDRHQSASQSFSQPAASTPNPLTAGITPRWRGVTLLHELKQAGVSIAVASDNCRDPFHGFGDHDMLEVFGMSAKIAHFDMPYGDWPQAVTLTPANLMGLPEDGRIGVGLPADLVVLRGRNFSELLARHQGDRVVLRNGMAIDTKLPDYAELDELMPDSSEPILASNPRQEE
jgi:cytosine deaminase